MTTKPTSGDGLDLVVLVAAHVGDEADHAGLAVGPRLDRPRPQAAGEMRGQHADAGLVDDVPDAVDVALLGHDALSVMDGRTSRGRGSELAASGKPAQAFLYVSAPIAPGAILGVGFDDLHPRLLRSALALLLNGQLFAAMLNFVLIVPCLFFGLIFHGAVAGAVGARHHRDLSRARKPQAPRDRRGDPRARPAAGLARLVPSSRPQCCRNGSVGIGDRWKRCSQLECMVGPDEIPAPSRRQIQPLDRRSPAQQRALGRGIAKERSWPLGD